MDALEILEDIRVYCERMHAGITGVNEVAIVAMNAASKHPDDDFVLGFAVAMCAAVSIITAAEQGHDNPAAAGLQALHSMSKED